jgi:hypothetical protein
MSLNDATPAPNAAIACVDWAEDNHAVRVLDADGQIGERVTIGHTKAGVRQLVEALDRRRSTPRSTAKPERGTSNHSSSSPRAQSSGRRRSGANRRDRASMARRAPRVRCRFRRGRSSFRGSRRSARADHRCIRR